MKDFLQPRPIVQTLYLLFCIYLGIHFFLFCSRLNTAGPFFKRPAAVEAFLPISAMVGLRHLFATGHWDTIHPAGLTIFLAILTSSCLFRRGFCSWVCPVGTLSSYFERIGKKARLIVSVPLWLDYPLMSIKYLLLCFFVYFIFFGMNSVQAEHFLSSPYNITADARMLSFFLTPSRFTIIVLVALALLSMTIKNLWCRYLCPYGAVLGIVAIIGPFYIRRNKETCIECKKCERICPMSIEITKKSAIRGTECIGCMDCLKACPEKDTLLLSTPFAKRIWTYTIPVGVILTLTIFYVAAKTAGCWESSVPLEVYSHLYRIFAP